MKKLLLFSSALVLGSSAFAQKAAEQSTYQQPAPSFSNITSRVALENSAAKTTGLSDSFYLVGQAQFAQIFDSSSFSRVDAALPIDSGYIFGTNPFNWNAYAEKYRVGAFGGDTTLQIIGFVALFTGRVQPGSGAKTIKVNVWQEGPQTQFGTKKYHEGFPTTSLKNQTYSIKSIGIANTGIDTIKEYYFSSPLSNVTSDFFLGYEYTYTWGAGLGGDTIALRSSRSGKGIGVGGGITAAPAFDTIYFDKNVYREGTTWKDFYWEQGIARNLSIVPIFRYSASTIGVGVTRGNLTFFGNYPNPAVNSTNIKFSLVKADDVTVQIVDISGRVINTIKQNGLGAGEHIVPVDLSSIAPGTYTYLVTTGSGDALAAKFSVVK